MRKILLFVCCLCLSFFCFTPFVNCCFPELENGGWCVLVGAEDNPEAGPIYVAARVAPVHGEGDVANLRVERELPRGLEGRPSFSLVRERVPMDRNFLNREFPARDFQEAKDAGEYVCWLAVPYAFVVYGDFLASGTTHPDDYTLCLRFRQLEGGNSFEVRTLCGRPVVIGDDGLGAKMCPVSEQDLRIPVNMACRWRYVSWDDLQPSMRECLQGYMRSIMCIHRPEWLAANPSICDIIRTLPVY